MAIAGVLLNYKAIIIFYLLIILWLIWKRKKIDVQAKFIFLYRMKWGLQWMDNYAKRFREWIILLGYVGVGAGFVGLVFISYILIKNLIDLLTKPDAVSGVTPVLPGINIPGIGILPFWDWIIAIFLIALVHEFAHGLVARAHRIPVKNTGIVFFGPILGAFVEPDEGYLRRQQDIKQYSGLAAGSFSNIALAIVALLFLHLAFVPLQAAMVEPAGFTFDHYYGENYPFEQAEIPPGSRIIRIGNTPVETFQEFAAELQFHRPGEMVTIHTAEQAYAATLAESPDHPGQPFLGVSSVRNEVEIKHQYQGGALQTVYYTVNWLTRFLRWLFLLSLGIGLFNLLPLPIVDGGRMAQVFLQKLKGEEKGNTYYTRIGLFFLFVLLILLLGFFFPGIGNIF